MYRFEGNWLDLFFTSFFILGLVWTGLLLLIILWSLLSSLLTRVQAKRDRKAMVDLLDPEKRRERLEKVLADANDKLDELNTLKEKEEKDGGRKGKEDES